jgi:hypothetical protein
MALLHIYDSSDWTIRETAWARGGANEHAVPNVNALVTVLDSLVAAHSQFDRILFETHGSPGIIGFGHQGINATWLLAVVPHQWANLTTPGARVYFNGCNVAEGPVGWRFLEAAAAVFLAVGGGEVFGQTSVGIMNPFNGHVVHLWGSTRRLYVARGGRITSRVEQ